MSIEVSVPGGTDLRLQSLLLDVNGTLTHRGQLLDGVQPRIDRLRSALDIHLLSADTFGTLDDIARHLGGLQVTRISTGQEKAAFAERQGTAGCAAVGNGANDQLMLTTVALGIAVIGPEGASAQTLAAADVATTTIAHALDLLLEPQTLTATLRP